jgi:2-keto-4-pentenoate hydratase/2-oxohepta-3-ene-1,7-dioic acid hydratase in catechol pathway
LRIARFAHSDGVAFGTVEGEPDAGPDALTVAEVAEHPFGPLEFTGRRWALADVRLLAPILPTKVIGIGRNYADHAAELGNEVPPAPIIFLKPNTAVIGPRDAIRLPIDSQRVDFEGELALVIQRVCKDVPRERVSDVIFGYTCANDVTARDQQQSDGQWTRAKGHDSFCPLGPWIETQLDPADLRLETTLDGEVQQLGRTSQLVHDIPTLVSYLSHVMTLLPGDVVLTGTPAGVGPMKDGQTVEVTIEGIGTLTNPVKAKES